MMEEPKQKRILVIERHDDFRESLSELLSVNNYEVINAKNGYLGLVFAREYLPDIIICARSFDDSSCWNVLQELRKGESTKHIPFIFLSSKPASDEHQRISEQDLVITMVKPIHTEELMELIQACFVKNTPCPPKSASSTWFCNCASAKPEQLNPIILPS